MSILSHSLPCSQVSAQLRGDAASLWYSSSCVRPWGNPWAHAAGQDGLANGAAFPRLAQHRQPKALGG
jgi:hypothetical protein